MIDGETKIVGVVGYPITHTLSPIMHNKAFEILSLNYVYLPFNVEPNSLDSFIDAFKKIKNFIGFNVTLPYKEEIIKYIDFLDKTASKIKAVNTVVKKNEKIYGYNTDAYGFITSLKKVTNPRDKTVLLLGAGGVARAIISSLLDNHVRKIFIYDINKEKMEKIKGDTNENKTKLYLTEPAEFQNIIPEVDIIINATPVGMKKNDGIPINPNFIRKDMVVYDVIYNRKTELIKQAEKIKAKAISGVYMFLYQGGKAFKIWTRKDPPLEVMLKSIKKFLN